MRTNGGAIQSFESSHNNISELVTMPQVLEHICAHAEFALASDSRAQLRSDFPTASEDGLCDNAAAVKARKKETKLRLESQPTRPRTARMFYQAEVYQQILDE